MLTVISPAKTLDFDTPPTTRKSTQPLFIERAGELVEDARQMSPDDIRALMGVSDNIAQLNHARFMNWSTPFTLDNAKQSVLAFKGDVYTGLEAETLSPAQLGFAQKHLCILSGLYGLLRPLDLMQPYRLEMGSKVETAAGKDLYAFWGNTITEQLNEDLAASPGPDALINLASNEYFGAVRPERIEGRVISPKFLDEKNGDYRMISFFAKKARGAMARFIIQNRLKDPERILGFDSGGYRYEPDLSAPGRPAFYRPAMAEV